MLGFPIYSLFSDKVGFSVFFRTLSGWQVYTRGKVIAVKGPHLDMLEYFRHFLPEEEGLVFDVGGELGHETEQFARLVGPKGRVLTFECLPDHVDRLQKLAARYPNVSVIERACWNKATTLEFSVGRTPGSGTAVQNVRGQKGQELADPAKTKLQVRAETLDSLWRLHASGSEVSLLKMDIEGAEYEALEGAREMLAKTKRAVIAAYHLRNGVRTAPRVAEMLRAAGFAVRIDENLHVYAVRPPLGF
jgi:FkbM family methyltransferase